MPSKKAPCLCLNSLVLALSAALAVAGPQVALAQSTTPAPSGSSPPSTPTRTYPPKEVLQFYMLNSVLIEAVRGPTNSDGKEAVTGNIVYTAKLKDALQRASDQGLPAAARQWIEEHEIRPAEGHYDADHTFKTRAGVGSNPADDPDYGDFRSNLAVIREQEIQKAQMQTELLILSQLGQGGTAQYEQVQQRIQGFEAAILVARSAVAKYVKDAFQAQRPPGGASGSGSGSGNTIVEGAEEFSNEAMDVSSAEALRDGVAIARAYIEPADALSGGSGRKLTRADVDGMLERIRIAESAVSSSTAAPASGVDRLVQAGEGAPLTVAALNPIYKNYRVTPGQNGSVVVSVTSAQVRTPTAVMTIPSSQITVPSSQILVPSAVMTVPSAQINVPSTQVNVPSSVMTVPSTQITVPSTQVRTPGSAMSSLDLQPALCGR